MANEMLWQNWCGVRIAYTGMDMAMREDVNLIRTDLFVNTQTMTISVPTEKGDSNERMRSVQRSRLLRKD